MVLNETRQGHARASQVNSQRARQAKASPGYTFVLISCLDDANVLFMLLLFPGEGISDPSLKEALT